MLIFKKISFVITLFMISLIFLNDTEAVIKANYELSIKAEYKKEKEQDFVNFEGSTNLPDKAIIYVILKTDSKTVLGLAETRTSSGKFCGVVYPIDIMRLPRGIYKLEAIFYPLKQDFVDVRRLIGLKGERIDSVTKGRLVYDEEKGESLIMAQTKLVIGSPDEIKKEKNKAKDELMWYINILDELQMQLLQKYEFFYKKGEDKFNKGEWLKWSKDWIPQVKRIQQKVTKEFAQSLTFEYSDLPMNIETNCRLLLQLHNIYLSELSNEKVKPAYPYAEVVDKDLLYKQISSSLKYTRRKLESL